MPKSPAKQQKGGEGGISRLCPLLKKMLMKNGWLGFSITFLLKHFYIFLGNLGNLEIFTKLLMFTKFFPPKNCL